FYFALAPLFALWPDPRSLLIAQALLVTAGAWPAYRLAARRLQSGWAGVAVATIYLLYPVTVTAVLFDIHGDTFALPFLLFALDALDRRAWRSYTLWLVLALSCKFYVAVPVAILGLVIWRYDGQRRVGLLTTAAAGAYAVLAFFVIRPLFTTATTSAAHRGLNYVSFYFGQFQELVATVDQRVLSAMIVFGPALFLAWRAWPCLLPAVPLALVALLSTGPGGGFDYRSHHYALVVPFIILAVVYAASSLRVLAPGKRVRNWRADLVMTTLIVLIAHAAFVDSLLSPFAYIGIPGRGFDPSVYGITARDAVIERFLDEQVRSEDKLMASMFFTPHVVDRSVLYAVRYPQDPGGLLLPQLLPRVDTVVADALFDYRIPLGDTFAGGVAYERAEIALLLRDPGFGLLTMHDGLLLFRRKVPSSQVLPQEITIVEAHTLPRWILILAQHVGSGCSLHRLVSDAGSSTSPGSVVRLLCQLNHLLPGAVCRVCRCYEFLICHHLPCFSQRNGPSAPRFASNLFLSCLRICLMVPTVGTLLGTIVAIVKHMPVMREAGLAWNTDCLPLKLLRRGVDEGTSRTGFGSSALGWRCTATACALVCDSSL
ncbi:DUF2079 domain-containing protein, partial [Candidatus Gracilibacteria bacterium]|nr:DUF2079 domain-containing protein [Candidatus Gracilibacteria bacterium]